ncbi:hypothetical protein SK128_019450 [Halocaridina rubra]|uniref:Fatty acid synthase n=1 Tax=Halocaridina rubra TaxID=373956 RepID=A0AAN9AAJ8_HALRR
MKVMAVPRMSADSHMVYVITGGMGGLGLELAGWLISRGAKKIVLTSRRGISTGYQALCVRRWSEAGINVRILTQDASTIEGATALLKDAAMEGPVGGIFHLAVVLRDSLFENQTDETFYAVNHVKGEGAIALDLASRTCCPKLHLWVAFSSVACGKGNAGQTNYGWANSVSERVVEERVKLGLPGVAIQWGGVGEVGVLAETLGDIEVGGTKPQSVRSVLECLDILLLNSSPVVSSVCLATKSSKKSDGGKGGSIVKSVANILGVKDLSKVPLEVTLGDLGLDSLMSVEVKQTLEREADLILTAAQVRELTLKMLQDMENEETSLDCKDAEDSTKSTLKSMKEQLQGTTVPWLTLPLVPTETVKVLKECNHSTPLFLTAPIHGSTVPLMEMCQQLNRAVYGLQYPAEVPHTSVPDLAKRLVKELQRIHPSGDFILGGYSFGTSITLEMTRMLAEEMRSPSSVVLLDGSQSYVSGIIDHYKARHIDQSNDKGSPRSKTEIQEQVEMLLVFAMQYISMDALALKNTLTNMKSWDERVNHVAQLVTESRKAAGVRIQSNEQQQAVAAAELLYKRLVMADNYTASYTLNTPTLLIRARDNPQASLLGHDYGLSKVLIGPLKIEEVVGSHETFLMGEGSKQVASCIQSFVQAPPS